MTLANVRIILVEPAGALNIGSVARVMKNMGLHQLWLVNPHCNPKASPARQMAVHGVDVLESAQQVATLPEALQGCQRAIATTARTRHLPTTLEPPRLALPWLLEDDITSALIFGPEDRGLSNDELNYAQRFVCIPANPEYPSLNLAQAVAICCYELAQLASPSSQMSPGKTHHGASLHTPQTHHGASLHTTASLDEIEAYFQHLEAVLLEIGYLHPHTSTSRMEKFRRLYYRAMLTPEDVAMLRGILRQTEWAVQFMPRSQQDESES
ncbi:MAG: RNA methyltransferase [Coleofasciculus sp. G3-WIS-01]|uniref:RNA methyltransferase n=1 Tax=Coleofasciculus sp. G3-WIS-01 TaxID=3069528 RepID=UPI003304B945